MLFMRWFIHEQPCFSILCRLVCVFVRKQHGSLKSELWARSKVWCRCCCSHSSSMFFFFFLLPPDFDPNLGMMAGISPLNPMMPGLGMVPAPLSQDIPLVKEIIHCKSCTLFPPNPSESSHSLFLVDPPVDRSIDEMSGL